MSAERKRSRPGFQAGMSLMPTLFVAVCLTLLGVLALSGALRDQRYSDKVSEKEASYYGAVSAAQHKLGEIDKTLAEIGENAENFERYLESVGEIFSETDGVDCAEDAEKTVLSYRMPVTESQSLLVELEVLNPKKGEGNYKIIKWQEIAETGWQEETPLPVLRFAKEE